jgi:hypothetical protein
MGHEVQPQPKATSASLAEKCIFGATKYLTISVLGMTTLRRSNAVCGKRNSKMPTRMSRSILVDGAEHVIPYGDTSQYKLNNKDGTSASACRLAALNFARIAFSMEQGGLQDTALLQAVMTPECAQVRRLRISPYPSSYLSLSPKEASSICALWSGELHLEVEDICHFPLFEKTLKLKTTSYCHPGASEFKSLLT